MRVLGIDYGLKKLGLALGDTETGIAVPLETIPHTDHKLLDDLALLIQNEGIEHIVVGVPLKTGGHHDSTQLNITRQFIETLRAAVHIPVEEEDESFTTAESIRLKKEEGARADEDALAAMLITRAHLETMGNAEA